MCFQQACGTCTKPTWAGCGKHIETALGDVAVADRCKCKPSTQEEFNAASTGTKCTAQ